MSEFEISESYRKYLTGIKLNDHCYYSVWGLDIDSDEQDKFLVKDNKIVLFESIENLKNKLNGLKEFFFDKVNFEKWLNEELFDQAYSTMDIENLLKISYTNMLDKEFSLTIINSLNILQDFFLQINEQKALNLYESDEIIELKDYIYNNFFWKKGDNGNNVLRNDSFAILKNVIVEIYLNFSSRVLIIA